MGDIRGYIGYVVIIGITLIITKWYVKYSNKKAMSKDIKKCYGTKYHLEKSYIHNNDYRSSFFENAKNEGFYIDEITWHDLNMEEIFKLIANTRTNIGNEVLYKLLRMPAFDEEELRRRERLISFFSENEKERFDVQLDLSLIGRNNDVSIANYFTDIKPFEGKFKGLYKILRYSPFILGALSFVSVGFGILLLLNIVINMTIHYRMEKLVKHRMVDYSYIINMIIGSEEIYKKNNVNINNEFKEVEKAFENIKKLKKKVIGGKQINPNNDVEILSEYAGIITLKQVINFSEIEKIINAEKESIRKIYEFVGEIDALIAVASFREIIEYEKPIFIKEKKISFKEIYNPLIKKPIKNDFETNKDILITGSNASGKSTFLRSIGLNCLLAQTINTVCAKDFKCKFFRVYTSMALSDNILSNDSYYMAEVKSLKRILDSRNEKEDFICFIDEVLRGTNTLERIAASTEILNRLAEIDNCICFGATHDIELTYILENKFKNYSFEEHIEGNEIKFDYKLKEGPSKTRNAIKILDFIGYEQKIIKRAEENVEYFIKNNKWTKIK